MQSLASPTARDRPPARSQPPELIVAPNPAQMSADQPDLQSPMSTGIPLGGLSAPPSGDLPGALAAGSAAGLPS